MTTSLVDAHSVLAIDIGSVNTRAFLFDAVDGEYRFIASGVVGSTHEAPYHDVGEGLTLAVHRLQETVGRLLLSHEGKLLLPSQPDGSGVDRLVLTFSVGPDLKIVTTGLLADVSQESAQRLAVSTYGRVLDSIGLSDHRRPDTQIEAILRAQPDIIILAGGTESGASRSVYRVAELVRMICQVLPVEKRPDVLYAGNQALAAKVKEVFEKFVNITIAPNVRPTVDVEDLAPAQNALAQVVFTQRSRQIGGLQKASTMCSESPIPSSAGFGRMVRFLGQIYDPAKGVMGVDLGANFTTLAVGTAGRLAQVVSPFGMGSRASQVLKLLPLDEIIQWLPMQTSEDVVQEYILQKGIFPASLPMTEETLAIEQAVARCNLRLAMQRLQSNWPDLAPVYEPILASGAVLSQAPTPGQALLMLMDGLQPVGITTVLLDLNNLLSSLGAVARLNSILPVQVIESKAFLNLGTVITPVSTAQYGTPILKLRLEYEDGGDTQTEIRQGVLAVLPLAQGRKGRIHLQPIGGTEIDPRKSGRGSYQVTGGVCGVVIDGRGRPLVLPPDAPRRREMVKKWILALGG